MDQELIAKYFHWFTLLTAVIRHAWDGSCGVKEQFLVCTGQHRQQGRNQTRVAETFANHSWQGAEKMADSYAPLMNKAWCMNNINGLHSLASSATSFAVSRVRGPLLLRDRARIGRIPLITTCSAAPLSGHKWSHTCQRNTGTNTQWTWHITSTL